MNEIERLIREMEEAIRTLDKETDRARLETALDKLKRALVRAGAKPKQRKSTGPDDLYI